MNYLKEIESAKNLLTNGNFILCSIQCGRILEVVLKNLFKEYSIKADAKSLKIIQNQLSYKNKSIERLTLGELSIIFDKINVMQKLSREYQIDIKELNFISLKTIVDIRNKAL